MKPNAEVTGAAREWVGKRALAWTVALTLTGSAVWGRPTETPTAATGAPVGLSSPPIQQTEPTTDPAVRAYDLADHDRVAEAVASLARAIAAHPRDVRAHAAYIRIKTYYLAAYDEVRGEYDAHMTREPANPVYPMAFALAVPGGVSARTLSDWYRRVSELTPTSVWGKYASAQLVKASDPQRAAADLRAAIDLAPSFPEPYEALLGVDQRLLKDLDAAMAVAEGMAAQPGLAGSALGTLWGLRFRKAGGTESAKQELRATLEKASATSDLAVLNAIRVTEAQVLNDQAAADRVAERMRHIDPSWYPTRGLVTFFGPANLSGVGRNDPLAGHSFDQLGAAAALDNVADPAEREAKLETLLKAPTSRIVTRFIRESLFKAAEEAGDLKILVGDGDLLMRLDPSDAAVPARMALAMAEHGGDLKAAERYADVAVTLTATYHGVPRPPNTDADLFAQRVPEAAQRRIFDQQRALALDAKGRVVCLLGDCARAEPLLRESVTLNRSERNLSHLASTLRALNRAAEADIITAEARAEFAASVRGTLISEPAKDFRLQTIGGSTITLESLKGKAVLINFWATSCGPCRSELPGLADLYRRAAARGLEILAVTNETPADRPRIDGFVQQYHLPFPVLYANGVDELYGVNGLPTTVGIDRAGRVRYRGVGYFSDTLRVLDVVIDELLK